MVLMVKGCSRQSASAAASSVTATRLPSLYVMLAPLNCRPACSSYSCNATTSTSEPLPERIAVTRPFGSRMGSRPSL